MNDHSIINLKPSHVDLLMFLFQMFLASGYSQSADVIH